MLTPTAPAPTITIPAAMLAELSRVLGTGLILDEAQRQTYECDGLTNFRAVPGAVTLPRTTAEVQAIVRLCHQHRIPFVSRGAGTGLSGGALPTEGCVVIGLARMNRILSVDFDNERVFAEPGVTNSQVTEAVKHRGYFFAPDPSSQTVCTLGGNVAENAGGAHCLKYGFTSTHVLGCEVVLPTGELTWLGSEHGVVNEPGYDLLGTFVGSEGTLGVVTSVVLRIVRKPETVQTLLAAFDNIGAAAQTVSDVIASGILASAMEIMDHTSIVASEAAVHAGYPDCEALLLVELDGPTAEVNAQMQSVRELAAKNSAAEQRLAQSDAERAVVWKGRKAAFAAMGRVSPNYIVQDGVIPRTALPRVLAQFDALSKATGLRIANVFHAGDGNLHPMVLYDGSIAGEEARALDVSYQLLRLCVDAGGSITGEHGVGREKQCEMSYMYAQPDLAVMQRVRHAFDPHELANPEKLFPTPRLCGERHNGPHREHPLVTAGIAEIF
ncbi:FAD-binding oxidoreductase [Granulicella cerasi]|uniref:FAD-binding oxidoreductase n=1 Tax=Granulicella cerasi TaxID=741063 RepID=A0ABW1Z777_9BACT|nr:FAD-linked oxidase C-terminal domain-containing protein [Granulicella cerasi]